MILVDVNLLLYAVNQDAPLHARAKSWLESVLSGAETIGVTWTVLQAFLRLTTRPGVFARPLPVETAFAVIDEWCRQPSFVIVEPAAGHAAVLRDLLTHAGTGGNLTSDAHLAAIAIGHGAELCSADGDFARFARLRWRNPLSS